MVALESRPSFHVSLRMPSLARLTSQHDAVGLRQMNTIGLLPSRAADTESLDGFDDVLEQPVIMETSRQRANRRH
jgi:hypothetical protein